MLFSKPSANVALENEPSDSSVYAPPSDDIETVVGPSVNVEGDFASEGNIIVKGSVAGSVHTSRHLSVEPGAKIMANVRAGCAAIAGDVRGNIKVKDTLELASTAKVVGDIEAAVLKIDSGALLFGKVSMPGLQQTVSENRSAARGRVGGKRAEAQILDLEG